MVPIGLVHAEEHAVDAIERQVAVAVRQPGGAGLARLRRVRALLVGLKRRDDPLDLQGGTQPRRKLHEVGQCLTVWNLGPLPLLVDFRLKWPVPVDSPRCASGKTLRAAG